MAKFEKYTSEIIYKASFEGYGGRPMNFTGKLGSIRCAGEGGNRHIYITDKTGTIDVLVDTHVYGAVRHKAFVSSVNVYCGNPSASTMKMVYQTLLDNAIYVSGITMYFDLEGLDKLFEDLYNSVIKRF